MPKLVEKITRRRNWKVKSCEKDKLKGEKIEGSQDSKKKSRERGSKK